MQGSGALNRFEGELRARLMRPHPLNLLFLAVALMGCGPAQAPAIPSFTGVSLTSSAVQLSWNAVPEASSYVLERGNGATPTAWTDVVLPSPTAVAVTDSGLTAGSTYTYRLKASNSAGSSLYTNKTITTLVSSVPSLKTPVVGANRAVQLTWTAVSGATSYTLERYAGPSISGVANLVALPSPTSTTATDTAPADGTFTYRVRANDANGAGLWSNSQNVTLIAAPDVPSNFTAIAANSVTVSLTWRASSNAAGYSVERGEGTAPTTWSVISSPSITVASDSTARPLATYTYRVRANNAAGSSDWVTQSVTLGSPQLEVVASGMDTPWSLNFTPDGRLLFTPRNQTTLQVRMIRPSSLGGTPITAFSSYTAAGVRVRVEGESGILGMDLDPNFASNNRVYICYAYYSGSTPLTRVSRFEISGNALINELKVIDAIPGGLHHGGCRVVVVGNYVFATMGDVGDPQGAQAQDGGKGRMFRVGIDGTIPPNNPFYNTAPTQLGKATWNYGLRNAQGLQLQPGTNLLWSTEHGESTRDEINTFDINSGGYNYGWPYCAGTQPFGTVINSGLDGTYSCTTASSATLNSSSYRPAVREYEGGEGATIAPSDLMFYPQAATTFVAWQGDLFFVTLKTGRLYRLALDGNTVGNGKGEILLNPAKINGTQMRLRDVAVGLDGYIYISTDDGYIFRLRP